MNQLSPFLLYSVKVAMSLALLYLPYRIFLSRLTFYRSNRYYLLGYSVLSLVAPLLNLGAIFPRIVNQYGIYLDKARPVAFPFTGGTVIQLRPTPASMPPIEMPQPPTPPWYTSHVLLYILLAGMACMLIRLAIQLVSFLKLKWQSTLLFSDTTTGIHLYSLKETIVPFSLGKNIFVHASSYGSEDMQRIIEHESAHIQQRHTLDIIFTQLLIIFQWWNPFIWFLQSAVRQNLEFLADLSVLQQGVDRKQYQYLLLNVSGTDAPLLSNSFNRSPLKKRVLMMNQRPSPRSRLICFVFGLPLVLFMLAAFSHHRPAGFPGDPVSYRFMGFVVESRTRQPLKGVVITDSVSGLTTLTDGKGYFKMDIPIDYSKDTLRINASCSKDGMKGTSGSFSTLTTGWPFVTIQPCDHLLTGMTACFGMAFKGDSIGEHNITVSLDDIPQDSAKYINESDQELVKTREHFVAKLYQAREMDSALNAIHQIYNFIDGLTYIRNDQGISFNTTGPVGILVINDSLRMTGEEINQRYSPDQVDQILILDSAEAQKRFGVSGSGFFIRIKEKKTTHRKLIAHDSVIPFRPI